MPVMNQALLHGFAEKSCSELPELNAKLHTMQHVRSGARLVWIERDDENKTFGIAFPTIPEDDTGVFHILEHSVLCGSERYPVKDPFVELMKSSLKTFLNAMTFPDKTYYPISSRNQNDFLNLMRVYMDAVLHPLIYSRPEIFAQEGWRYEFSQEDGAVSYQGVVLNEMKGAFSSADTLMRNEVNRQLFPDAAYRYVYGGDPACIPDLTHEQFLDCHRRFYHPSNAYIVLDGNMDIDQVLSLLDEEYLSAYTWAPRTQMADMQLPVKRDPVRIFCESAPGESGEGRSRLAFGYVLGDYTCQREIMAVRALADVLCGSNDAPLKKRILSAGLAKDVRIRVMSGILQPYVTLEVLYIKEDQQDKIREIITEEICRLIHAGLDHEQLAATLANMEFQTRERDYGQMPRGLGLSITVLESWMYGGDPAADLEVGGLFQELNQSLEKGYFEDVLKRVFLENTHTCQVLLVPSANLGQERQQREAQRLREEQAAWGDAKRAALVKQQQDRLVWQSTPDSTEALAALPKLRLSDIPAQPRDIPTEMETIRGLPFLHHLLPTGGVDYVNLYFDVSDLHQEQISQMSLLCGLMGSLDTDKYTTTQLQRLIRLHLGTVRFALETYGSENQPDACRTYLCASFSALEAKMEHAAALVTQILTGTQLVDPQKIRQRLRQTIAWMERGIIANGSTFAMMRVAAGFSADGMVREHSGGIAWYQWLKELDREFETRTEALIADMLALRNRCITAGRLTVSITGQDTNAAHILKTVLLEQLPSSPRAEYICPIVPWGPKREGIVIPADVSFTALGGSLARNGCPYSGATPVLCKVMTLGYLWGAVRGQGGAYGTGLAAGDTGGACFYSFRDPNAFRTLGCYRQSADFLRQLPGSVPDLTDFIIGAVAASDIPLMPKQQGKTADGWYWQGATYADRCQQRCELLTATPDALVRMADSIEKLTETAGICVIGSNRQIEACGAELEHIFVL